MERKILFLVFLFSVVLLVGLVLFLQQEEETPPAPEASVEDTPGQDEEMEQETAGEKEETVPREAIAPEAVVPEALRSMPASFMKALGGIKGRVVEEDGAAVPGMKVEIHGAGVLDLFHDVGVFMGDTPLTYELKSAGDVTGADGTFFVKGAYPNAYYALVLDAEGPRAYARILDRLPGTGEVLDLGDIILPPFATLTGTVVDDEGSPVAGARIRAADVPPIVFLSGVQDLREGCSFLIQERRQSMVISLPPVFDRVFRLLPVPTVLSGSDGAFCLEGVPAGRMNVIVDREGHVTASPLAVSVKAGEEKDLGRLELDRGVPARGKVVNADGKPVEGVEVRVGPVYSFDEVVILQPPVKTDEKGAFSVPGFASRPTFAAARRNPEDPWTVEGPFTPGGALPTLSLPNTYSLKVTVKREDESPVTDARIKIRPTPPSPELSFLEPPTILGDRIMQTGEGIYEIHSLGPGRYELLVVAPGCGVETEICRIKEGMEEEVVVLEEAHTAAVKVLDARTELPLEWAEVYITKGAEDFVARPTRISRSRTDVAGNAVLKKVKKGSYHITASHPGYALTVESIDVPSVEERLLYLQRGGTVEGTVHQGFEETAPPYMIMASQKKYKGERYEGSPEMGAPRIAATDLEGAFKITNLTPGQWRIYVMPRIFHRELNTLFEVDERDLKREYVDVVSGETARVDLFLGKEQKVQVALSGLVTVDGVPAAGARVKVRNAEKEECAVDTNGRYFFDQVSSGRVFMEVKGLPGVMNDLFLYRTIEVAGNMPHYEDFQILTGSIKGRIVSETGGAVPQKEYQLYVNSNHDSGPYSVRVNIRSAPDGTFAYTGLPMGSYRISSHDEELLIESMPVIKVFPGRESGPVILTRRTPVIVKGRVVLDDDWDLYSGYFWVDCRSTGENARSFSGFQPSPETGEFETKRLIPGTYEARVYGPRNIRLKPVSFTVPPEGCTNLVLEFEEE